ncbi:hypothetical protein BDY21DRAFT_330401 [Lineolata rhizophorae]|uniref:Uncharacterized protein n=1 Tax=Lineolata rhizophorae TaxID=578093 RepID=A0A6A6PFD4_9PEZI|nr:hypothetical protein BDY21DRAFT_330401 [Lineolata rhizophorae]
MMNIIRAKMASSFGWLLREAGTVCGVSGTWFEPGTRMTQVLGVRVSAAVAGRHLPWRAV